MWLALALVVVALAYAPVVGGGFLWDDYDLIVRAPAGESIAQAFTRPFWSGALSPSHAFYRPLIVLGDRLESWLWSGSPTGFHLTNLILHLVCVVLVAQLCRRAGAGWPVAGLLAATFGLLPRLTESVAWVSGRTDPAATVGALGACLLYRTGPGAWGRKIASALLLLFGLLCKEVALAAFVALVIYEWRAPGARSRKLCHLLPHACALTLYLSLRAHAMATVPVENVAPRPLATVLLTAAEAFGRYVVMLLDPFDPRVQIGSLAHPAPGLALLGAAVAMAIAWVIWRKRTSFSDEQWMALGLAGTAIALVLRLVRLDVEVVAADRFLYLPCAALCIFVAAPVQHAWDAHRRWVAPIGLSVLALFAIVTSRRVLLWSNELAFWREAVRTAPAGNPTARVELSIALMSRERCDEAVRVLDEDPQVREVPLVRANRATCLARLGRRDQAIRELEEVRHAEPDRPRHTVSLALAYAGALRFDDARALVLELERHSPDAPELERLRALLDQAQAGWSSLPPEASTEPPALQARRASVFEKLGATDQAVTRWLRVLRAPDAPPDLKRHAAGYLALHAEPQLAREAIDLVARDPSVGIDATALEAALKSRFDDGA
jgi:hypothetical protein